MAQTRETRITLRGLETNVNPYLAEPGSLRQATNIMIRKPGVIESRIGFEDFADLDAVDVIAVRWFSSEGDESLLVGADMDAPFWSTWNQGTRYVFWVDSLGGVSAEVAPDSGVAVATRGAVARMRGRFVLDAINDPRPTMVLDEEGSVVSRPGGLTPPSFIVVDQAATGGAAISGDLPFVAYRAHFERKHPDGYIQTGPVSPSILYRAAIASGQHASPSMTVYWSGLAGGATGWVQAGDILRVYRTDGAESPDAVGDTMRLAGSVELTAGDVTNRYAVFTDKTPDIGLGAFLYTNNGQASIDASRWFAPSAWDIIAFQDVLWYHTPYAHRAFTLRVAGYWGGNALSGHLDTRVGSFAVEGSFTHGSPSFTALNGTEVGLSPGQMVVEADSSGSWSVGQTIISVVGTTVTMSAPAAANGPFEFFSVEDRIEINGENYSSRTPARLMEDIASRSGLSAVDYPAWVFANKAVFRDPVSIYDSLSNYDPSGFELTFISPSFAGAKHTIRATNGARYSPPLPELGSAAVDIGDDDYRTNRMHFSDIQQPEAVQQLSYRSFGRGRIIKAVAVEDLMFTFCTDGTYATTGDGINWSTRLYDSTLILLHRNAVVVMNGVIYALTNRGVVEIAGTQSARVISAPIQDLIRNLLTQFAEQFDAVVFQQGATPAYQVMMAAHESANELWLRFRTDEAAVYASFVYNTDTQTWTTVSGVQENPTAIGYSRALDFLLLGYAGSTLLDNASVRVSLPPNFSDVGDRMVEGTALELNPFRGADVNTQKEFLEVVYDLRPLDGTDDLEILPFFGAGDTAVEYPAPYTVDFVSSGPLLGAETEHVVKVPRNAARAKQLRPGFEVTGTVAENTAEPFELTGVTVKYRTASPDTRRQ